MDPGSAAELVQTSSGWR